MTWIIRTELTADIIDALSLARRSLRGCPAIVHLIENGFDGTHHADICVRADGQDYHAEGDWARWALRVLRKIASESGVKEIPDGDGGHFPMNEVTAPAASKSPSPMPDITDEERACIEMWRSTLKGRHGAQMLFDIIGRLSGFPA